MTIPEELLPAINAISASPCSPDRDRAAIQHALTQIANYIGTGFVPRHYLTPSTGIPPATLASGGRRVPGSATCWPVLLSANNGEMAPDLTQPTVIYNSEVYGFPANEWVKAMPQENTHTGAIVEFAYMEKWTPVKLAYASGNNGGESTVADFGYVVTDLATDITLAADIDPTETPLHDGCKRTLGVYLLATGGIGYRVSPEEGGVLLRWADEEPDAEVCLEE